MQQENPQQQIANTDDEIDLIALVKNLWDGRRTIIIFTLVGAALGLCIALLTPKEYTANTTMVPQSGQSGSSRLSGLSSLAAMAGFNLNTSSNTESLSPLVYPQIVQSVPFQLELMNTPFQFAELDHPVSLFEYYTGYKKTGILGNIKKYTLGLPAIIIKALKPEQPKTNNGLMTSKLISLTREQDNVRKSITANLSLEVNEKEGFLTLSARFHDAVLAAQVAQKAQNMLQEYITTYKIQKAQQQLSFIGDRYDEKKNEFEKTQEKLARFRDQNKNVSSAIAQTEEERLQSEYNIAFSVYSELAKQLEQAQIQVKEDTPILTILEPVRVPLEKSKPNRPMILFIWIFLGGVIGTATVFGKEYLASIRQQWKEEEA